MTDNEFLVRIVINGDGVPAEELESLRAAEAVRARELGDAGVLRRLWRLPDGWTNVGLWSAPSRQALEESLDSLPLRPHMTIDIESLGPHPSDPGGPRRIEPSEKAPDV